MGESCEVLAHAWATSEQVTLTKGPDFNESFSKIPVIKALRSAIPSPLGNSLKETKDMADNLQRGDPVKVRVSTPLVLAETLKGFGILVQGAKTPELSKHAQRVLEAIRSKPGLLEELRTYFQWEMTHPGG